MANLDPAILAQFKARNGGGSGGTNYTGTSWIDTPEWRYEPVYQNDGGPEGGSTSLIGYNQFQQGADPSQPDAAYAMYNPDGSFNRYGATHKVDHNGLLAAGVLAAITMGYGIPAMMGTGAGAGAAPAIGGAGSTGVAGPGMAGWGADLGMEGLAGTVGSGGVGFTGAAGAAGPGMAGWGADLGMEGLANTVGSGGAGFSPSAGGGLWDTVKSGASSMFSGGGGAGGGAGGLGGLSQYIGPLASLYSGAKSAGAAKDAAGEQVAALDRSNALQAAMYDKQVALQEPFRQGGISGLNAILSGMGLAGDPNAAGYGSLAKDFSMADYQADPGYQFRQSEGEKAIQRAASAAGRSDSGRAYKDLTRFNSGLASDEYGNAFNRFQINRTARLNPLQSLMGAGQSSANTLTSAAGNYGQNVGNNYTQAGDARAAGRVGSANAVNQGVGSAWNMYQQNQAADQQNKMLNYFMNKG